MSKRAALIAAVVAVALASAVTGATAALRVIGGGAFGPGGRPLSETDVRRSLHAATPAPTAHQGQPSQDGSPSPRPSTQAGQRTGTFSTAGGAVFASCASGQATLTRWIPASGFGTDGFVQGPARSAWVTFKSSGSEVTVTVTCVSGRPHFAASTDQRGGGGGGHGGDDHGGGGSKGGGSGRSGH